MAQAAFGGIELHYETTGRGEPVVFIHGALIADAFRPLFGQPALSGYRLIAYRRRAYAGSSTSEGVLSVSQQAADCAGLLRHLEINRAHVVGHSFGGAVALQLALDEPERVASLSLLEPALMVGASGAPYKASLEEAIRQFHEAGTRDAVHAMMEARWPGYREGLEEQMPGAFEAAVGDAEASFDIELPGLLQWTFGEAEARRVSQPVLSVMGGESGALSPRFREAHEWLSTTMTAEGYILPGAHHFLQMENPSGMAEALAAFFARHPIS